ncbi:hypothetical protein [Acuticoccus sediminis]|uniref:hypothetical protein n=1 Tax=Acuticoccus sediminis TaxID=2184697 RepID=UPI0011B93A09|nr:hypothetical protein [Acuticoccus sediminis]
MRLFAFILTVAVVASLIGSPVYAGASGGMIAMNELPGASDMADQTSMTVDHCLGGRCQDGSREQPVCMSGLGNCGPGSLIAAPTIAFPTLSAACVYFAEAPDLIRALMCADPPPPRPFRF